MEGNSLGRVTVDMVAKTGSLEADVGRATKSIQGFTKQTEEQKQSLERLVGQLDPTVAAYSRLDKMEEQLRQHRKSGQLDPKEYERFSSVIEKQRKEVEKSSVAYSANSKTAKELAFSARGLPAQFTDIAVSLQGGQRPLSVLLQQGGQLKDMFGGIGPAIRYMTGYVIGLINPLTVAAASVGLLTYGLVKGQGELNKFQKQLISTGNQSGATSEDFLVMSQSIDSIVGTQAAAGEALGLIASKGSIAADQFEAIAVAALKFEKASGQAIETTIDQFAELSKQPVSAIEKLNEKYNFLTGATYEQITALYEEGNAAKAAELAYKTFADSIEERSERINESLGSVQRGWRSFVTFFKESADAVASVGRDVPLEESIKDVTNILLYNTKLTEEQRAQKEAYLKVLQEELAIENLLADAKATGALVNSDSINAQKALNAALKETLTESEKLEARYAEIEAQVARAALTGVYYTGQQIAALRTLAEVQYSDKDSTRLDAAKKLLENLKAQTVLLTAQNNSVEKLSKAEEDLLEWNYKISELKNKEILTADEKSLLLNADAITLQYEKNVQVQGELDGREAINDTMEDFAKLMKALQTDEQKLVNLTAERLALLEKARDAGGIAPAAFDAALNSIVGQSVERAPAIPSSIGGDPEESSQMKAISKAEGNLADWYSTQIDMLEQNRAARADLNIKWDEIEASVYEEYMVNAATLTIARQEAALEESNKEYEKFAESAAKNIQSAFADFLFDPFDEGVRGMLLGFVNAMRRMLAEAASAKALKAGLSFLTSSTNPVLGAIGSVFSGTRDTGGRGLAGKSYLIGSGAQPEMFVPDQAGTFIPNADKLGGNGGESISLQLNVDATDPGAEGRMRSMIEREVFPKIVEVAMGRTLAAIKRPRFS